jgi:hypothetical protein
MGTNEFDYFSGIELNNKVLNREAENTAIIQMIPWEVQFKRIIVYSPKSNRLQRINSKSRKIIYNPFKNFQSTSEEIGLETI